MSQQNEQSELGQREEIQSEPVKIETENIFDADLVTPESDPFQDDPMKIFASLVGDLKDMARRPPVGILAELPPTEHKVRIFQINNDADLEATASEIEALLNEGYYCHQPTVCNDFLIMDFSRRKETEEDGRH